KKIFQLGRTLADVILVGAGTALIERYRGVRPSEVRAAQRVELGLAPVPPIAVVSRRCTVLPDSPLVTDAVAPTIVFTTAAAPAATGVGAARRRHAVAALPARCLVTPPPAGAGGFSLGRWAFTQDQHRAQDQPGPVFNVERADDVRVGGVPACHAGEVGLGDA